ncbi:hypothetical protein J2790_003918 [Paenarthrobacter nicotinovorans]|nr:hypothetical protein [Paenarthrobacter nicotinovorans]SCZ56401.1 hypothetical protein SAMN02799638_01820 [Arthrobacter sp. UNCCL28]
MVFRLAREFGNLVPEQRRVHHFAVTRSELKQNKDFVVNTNRAVIGPRHVPLGGGAKVLDRGA